MKKTLLVMSLFTMGLIEFLHATSPQKPTLSRVYAAPFKPAVDQYNDPGEIGTLDDAYWNFGSLNLSDQLANGSAKAVRTLADGSVLVLLDDEVDSVVAKYTATGFLETITFGVEGIATVTGLTNSMFMELDSQDKILVGGGLESGSTGWMKRITTVGALDTTFNTNFAAAGTWAFVGDVAQQTSGRYIVVGLNSTGHAQIAGFLLNGLIDTTFGTNGYIIFNGSDLNHPFTTFGLLSVSVSSDDSIFVGYKDPFTSKAILIKFDINGNKIAILNNNVLSGGQVLANKIRVSLDASHNIVIAGTLSNNTISVSCYTSDLVTAIFSGTFIPSSGGNAIQLAYLVTLSNGYFAVVSSDMTNLTMRIDQFNSAGAIDTNFNAVTASNPDGTPGYLEFSPSSVRTVTLVSNISYGAAVSQDGQIYLAGTQTLLNDSTTVVIPYLSKIYDYQYCSQVPQYPTTDEQGNRDLSFGSGQTESVSGVPFLYNGNFGQSLQQQAQTVIQTVSGNNLLIGSSGFTDSSALQNMMLTQLTPAGLFDNSFGTGGKLVVSNDTTTNENMVSLFQGESTNLYIAGTSEASSFLRSYTSAGVELWNAPDTNNSLAVGAALQGATRALLFVADASSTTGHMSGYQISGGSEGTLDPTFGQYVSPDVYSGQILTGAYGLNMGPIYGGGVVNAAENIFIAYASTVSPSLINVAAILQDGSGLVTEFASTKTIPGIFDNVFGALDTGGIIASNVRIALTRGQNIMVTAVNASNTTILVTVLDGVTGDYDSNFNGGNVLSIPIIGSIELSINNLTCISDGSAMITGYDEATNPVMFTLRINSIGALDTKFNSQGSQPGVLEFIVNDQTADYYGRQATGLTIQSSQGNVGNIVMTAFEQQTATQSTPEVLRIFGQPNTTQVARFPMQDQQQGTLDVSLNGDGAITLNGSLFNPTQTIDMSPGAAKVVFVYPAGNVYEGMMLIGIDNGTTTVLGRINLGDMTLDLTFGTAGIYTVSPALTGASTLSIDANNKIIIGGVANGIGWAQQLSPDAKVVGSTPAAISFDVPPTFLVYKIYQQKSGRYIIACNDYFNNALLLAYQNQLVDANTQLMIDATFNPLQFQSMAPGSIGFTGSGGLYDLSICSDDTILVAYQSNSTIKISKVLANGAGFVDSFGSSGTVSTEITADSASVIRLVVDEADKIIVAASCDSGTDLQVIRYTATGVIDTTWNPFHGDGTVTTITGVGSVGVMLTDVLETIDGKTILTGYNSTGANGPMFAVRLTNGGILDTTWNPDPTSPDVAGILTSNVDGITNAYQSAIAIDGNVYVVGGTIGGASLTGIPLLLRIVGASYITAVQQDYLASPAGTLDYTLDPTGALNLNIDTDLYLGIMNNLHIYQDGSMLMVSADSSMVKITKLNATLAIDTTFGTQGQVIIENAATCSNLFVADGTGEPGYIYTVGVGIGFVGAARISSDGSVIALTAILSGWTQSGNIRTSLAGDIVVSGFNGTYGALAQFTPDGLGLDPLFGNGTPGMYTSTSTNPITTMTVDNYSRIYIAYLDSVSSNILVQRLLPSGVLDTTFATISIVPGGSNVFSNYMVLELDIANSQLALAATIAPNSGGSVNVYRFSTVDGLPTGTAAVSIPTAYINLSDMFIDSDQNIYVIGANGFATPTPGYQTIVARIASTSSTTIALDPTYATLGGTPGIANIVAGPLSGPQLNIADGGLDPDGRVYVIGNAGNIFTPYMIRLFGDNYYEQVSQALNAIVPGDFDYTYGYDGVVTTYANGASTPEAEQQVRAIRQLQQGTQIMTVVGDDVNSWTVRLVSDGTNDATYGAGLGIEIAKLTGNEIVADMVFDGAGNSIVCGSNSVAGGYVKSILPSGNMNTSFGGFTGDLTTTSYPNGTAYIPQLDVVLAVAQLSNGNFVFVGSKNNVGMIGMLSQTGALVPFGTDASGFILTGQAVTSVSINSNNQIYVSIGYSDAGVIKASVAQFDASGNLLGCVNDVMQSYDVVSGIDDQKNIRFVLSNAQALIIAASGNQSYGTIQVNQLESDGSVNPEFNNGNPFIIDFAQGSTAVVTSLVSLTNGDILVSGYLDGGDIITNNDYEFVACVTNGGIFDVTFNPTGPTPGLLMFQVDPDLEVARHLWDMNIQIDGKILLAGDEDPAVDQSTPLTMRLDGYTNVQSVTQFPGIVIPKTSELNTFFNGTGMATTDQIIDIVDGGDLVVDSLGRSIIGGYTSDNTFVVVRFSPEGILDPIFGANGVATSTAVTNTGTIMSSYLAMTSENEDVIIGGILENNGVSGFVCVKFSGVDGSQVTSGFGTSGIASTGFAIPNLNYGGFLTVDLNNNILIAGSTSDFQLAVARFLPNGTLDTNNFNQAGLNIHAGVALTGTIPYLRDGGSVITDALNCVYLGGSTFSNTMIVVKFTSAGILESSYIISPPYSGFGVNGIATTTFIDNLVDGGSVALDNLGNVVVGGYTSDQTFVVGRFLSSGLYDPNFSSNGIVYSNPIGAALNVCGDIAVDTNNSIVIGGMLTSYYLPMSGQGRLLSEASLPSSRPQQPMSAVNMLDEQPNSMSSRIPAFAQKYMVAARWLQNGTIDTTFSSTGLAFTGSINGFVSGGFVGTDIYDHVFIAGFTLPRLLAPNADGRLVIAEFYSGEEIFVNDPNNLSPEDFKIYVYGNNPELFEKYLALNLFARVISDSTAQAATLSAVQIILDNYVQIYQNEPGYNLIWHLYKEYGHLIEAQTALILNFPSSTDGIHNFFSSLFTRIGVLTGHYIFG